MQEECIMLFIYYSFFCRNEKSLLNLVSERIIFLKLVYRINNTRRSFQKTKLPFKLPKPQFVGRILRIKVHIWISINVSLEELWKYMIFYILHSWSRRNRTQKYVRCTVHNSRIRSEMSWGSIHTKINMNP